ncbi:MAG: hypothetical protein QOJ25_1989 [Solirubrobacteraceae bacterium]|nr:hypothetical protein [Solirubrobacteraceae bacterium]
MTERGVPSVAPRPFDFEAAMSDTAPRGDAMSDPAPRGEAMSDPALRGDAMSDPAPRGDAMSDPAPRGDARALHPLEAELIAAAGAVLLLVALLFLKWFGVGGAVGRFAPRAETTASVGAWHALTIVRWLALLTVVVALLPLLVRLGQRWLGVPRRIHAAVAAFGGVTALLLSYRVLIDLPDPSRVVDQKAGAILGVVGALVIAVGGVESMRGQEVHSARPEARGRSRRDRGISREIARINP